MRKPIVVALALSFGFALALAEPPAAISWRASQFMVRTKIVRYLPNGSGIEHKVATVKREKVCNGWISLPDGSTKQTCHVALDAVDDLGWTYRFREYDADGRLVADTVCQPLLSRWDCGPVAPSP